uniref:Uncharacterized protein n=1 Tax=Globisporangium ultimum (strain ATCC 200006 / CBS 805.95 / DAOM BR144) TaxID=431595 RepID=K3WG48_GLOUD
PKEEEALRVCESLSLSLPPRVDVPRQAPARGDGGTD